MPENAKRPHLICGLGEGLLNCALDTPLIIFQAALTASRLAEPQKDGLQK